MPTGAHRYWITFTVGWLLWCSAVLPISAAVIYVNDFSSNPSGDFTFYGASINYAHNSSAEVLAATRSDANRKVGAYQLTAPGFTGLSDVVVQTSLTVTTGSLQNNYALIGGVYGRITPGPADYLQGYYAVLGRDLWVGNDPTMRLYLGRDMGPDLIGSGDVSADMGTVLGEGSFAAVGDTEYVLRLSMNERYLVAQLWNSTATVLLDQVTANDSTYSQGNVGYLTALRSGSSVYTYDNFLLDDEPMQAVIPEPDSLVLGLIGAGLIFWGCRRAKKTRRTRVA